MKKGSTYVIVVAVIDVIIGGAFCNYLIYNHTQDINLTSIFPVAGYLLLLYFSGTYTRFYRKSRVVDVLRFLFVNCIFASLLFALLIVIEGNANLRIFLRSSMLFLFVQTFSKAILLTLSKQLLKNGIVVFNTLIIGNSARAIKIYTELASINQSLGMNFIGYLSIDNNQLSSNGFRHLGSFLGIEDILKKNDLDVVIIVKDKNNDEEVEWLLKEVQGSGLSVNLVPQYDFPFTQSAKINHITGIPIVEVKGDFITYDLRIFKRVFDVLFSIGFTIFFSPLILFAYLRSYFSTNGHPIYKQKRVGYKGKEFTIYKFRSMRLNAEQDGPMLSSHNDSRITSWGAFMRKMRIDELPQFYNVLKGEMSIVGPRPERPYFVEKIRERSSDYKYLFKVKPGITSLGQVKFGYAENIEEMIQRLRYDLIYLNNMSLMLDFRILVYTFFTVIKGKGK